MSEPIAAQTPGARWSRGLPGTERSLVRRASDGDPKAFETIFKRHAQELYRYCLAILRRPEDAQDALQSTMANALRSLPGEQREIKLRPWLFRVAHNEAITVLRQRQTTIDPDEVVEQSAPGTDATVSDRERLRTLVADLGSLPEQQRSALVMQELNGMSHDEVASALEISPGAARQAVYEARSALTEIGEGREMGCDNVRQKISARDGRLLRGRKVRAHLRACERCQDFAAGIDQRRTDFAALFPPMPAAAAASVFATVTGGTLSGGGGAVAGTAGAGGLGAISAKGAALVAATAAIGVGAAGYSGAVDIPLPGAGDGDDTSTSAGSQAGGSENSAGHRQDAGRADAGRGKQPGGRPRPEPRREEGSRQGQRRRQRQRRRRRLERRRQRRRWRLLLHAGRGRHHASRPGRHGTGPVVHPAVAGERHLPPRRLAAAARRRHPGRQLHLDSRPATAPAAAKSPT